MNDRWEFDLAVEEEEPIYSIDDLLRLATAADRTGRFDECLAFLQRATSNPRGRLQLARFYLDHWHELDHVTYEQSLREAEQLLLSIQDESKAACKLLSEIYISKRRVAALAFAIKADDQESIRRCRMKLGDNTGIQELESEPQACYLLASNLMSHDSYSASTIEYLLQIASSTGNGMVMLTLAQFYEIQNEKKLARDYYWAAAELGCPELLSKV